MYYDHNIWSNKTLLFYGLTDNVLLPGMNVDHKEKYRVKCQIILIPPIHIAKPLLVAVTHFLSKKTFFLNVINMLIINPLLFQFQNKK